MNSFDFRTKDLFKTTGLAFNAQRLWIQFIGLLAGYAGYYLFAVLSLLVSGYHFNQITFQFGLFPCLFAVNMSLSLLAKCLFTLGCVYFVIVMLITNTAVSRSTFMTLRNNTFFTWRDAVKFALKKAGSIILTPLTLSLLIGLFLLCAWLVGLSGKVPFAGELGISVFALLWIASSLIFIFILFAIALTFLFTPAILAVSDEDGFEAIYQSLSLTRNQIFRVIFYEALVGILSIAGFVLSAVLTKSSFLLMNNIFVLSMQHKYSNIIGHAQYLLQNWTSTLTPFVNKVFGFLAPYLYFTHDFIPVKLSTTQLLSANIFSINLLLIGGLLISYLIACLNSGTTVAYILLRWNKDGENLLQPQADTRKEDSTWETLELENDKNVDDIK